LTTSANEAEAAAPSASLALRRSCKILIVLESFCDSAKFLDGKDNVLFGTFLPYKLRMQVHRSPLGVNVLSVHNAVHNNRSFFNLKKHPVLANAEPILRREIGEPLDVSGQSVFQFGELHGNSLGFLFLQGA